MNEEKIEEKIEEKAAEKPCRHEYVRIYQRRLKGLDRRLVSTRAYLPIGFKQADFGHLSEGSYCFCTNCRARLYPKRTQADKLAARIALAQGKLNQAAEMAELLNQTELAALVDDADVIESTDVRDLEDNSSKDIHVEELELESVDAQDIEAEGVKLTEDADTALSEEDM